MKISENFVRKTCLLSFSCLYYDGSVTCYRVFTKIHENFIRKTWLSSFSSLYYDGSVACYRVCLKINENSNNIITGNFYNRYLSSNGGTCTIQRVTGFKKLAIRSSSVHMVSYFWSNYRQVTIRMQSVDPESEFARNKACLFILRSVNRHCWALDYQGIKCLKRNL